MAGPESGTLCARLLHIDIATANNLYAVANAAHSCDQLRCLLVCSAGRLSTPLLACREDQRGRRWWVRLRLVSCEWFVLMNWASVVQHAFDHIFFESTPEDPDTQHRTDRNNPRSREPAAVTMAVTRAVYARIRRKDPKVRAHKGLCLKPVQPCTQPHCGVLKIVSMWTEK